MCLMIFDYSKCDHCGKKKFGKLLLLVSMDREESYWAALCKQCRDEIK